MNELTPKQRKFVKAKVEGLSNRKAGEIAGAISPIAADQYAQRMSKNVKVQQAIEHALNKAELTPEFAISELKRVVEQNDNYSAKRGAITDVLELHGYHHQRQNNLQLNIKQGFFKVSSK